jgi:hypothetical protein
MLLLDPGDKDHEQEGCDDAPCDSTGSGDAPGRRDDGGCVAPPDPAASPAAWAVAVRDAAAAALDPASAAAIASAVDALTPLFHAHAAAGTGISGSDQPHAEEIRAALAMLHAQVYAVLLSAAQRMPEHAPIARVLPLLALLHVFSRWALRRWCVALADWCRAAGTADGRALAVARAAVTRGWLAPGDAAEVAERLGSDDYAFGLC